MSGDKIISLADCYYDKERKVLKLDSSLIGMPGSFFVKSHITGKVVKFMAVWPGDSLFDPDGWDGEACYYRPAEVLFTVDHLVISHFN